MNPDAMEPIEMHNSANDRLISLVQSAAGAESLDGNTYKTCHCRFGERVLLKILFASWLRRW